jgi:hypothetical protein
VVSLLNGATERTLNVTPPISANWANFGNSFWSADGKRIIAEGNFEGTTASPSTPDSISYRSGIRVWLVSTGEIERDLLDASRVTASPNGKTLAYSDTVSGALKFLNLETGVAQSIPGILGTNAYTGLSWNSSGSKVYLSFPYEGVIKVWNSDTLTLEKTFSETGVFVWNSLGAPADTGVAPYAQSYDPSAECSLKILDLNTLKATRILDESKLDAFEVKLSLNATYLNENEYGITGTAQISGTEFKVRGIGTAGSNGRLVPQTSPVPVMPALLELLDTGGKTVWSVSHFETSFISIQPGSMPANDYGYWEGSNGGPDRYNLQLVKTP